MFSPVHPPIGPKVEPTASRERRLSPSVALLLLILLALLLAMGSRASAAELDGKTSATMYEADGVGLAATQVDVHECVIVIDTSDARDRPRVLINPRLLARSEEMVFGDEGCLSVPQVYDKVPRHARVTVQALGRDGKSYEFEAEGLEAVCVQHEMDHLLGKVFVEYLSPLKRNRIKTRMLKRQRDEALRA